MQGLSRQGCDNKRSSGDGATSRCIFSILFIWIQDKSVHIGKHVGSQALRASKVEAVVAAVVVVDSYYTGGSRAWTRRAPWYVPFGEVVCVVSLQHVSMFEYDGGAWE